MEIQKNMRYYNREMHLNNLPTLKLKIKDNYHSKLKSNAN